MPSSWCGGGSSRSRRKRPRYSDLVRSDRFRWKRSHRLGGDHDREERGLFGLELPPYLERDLAEQVGATERRPPTELAGDRVEKVDQLREPGPAAAEVVDDDDGAAGTANPEDLLHHLP